MSYEDEVGLAFRDIAPVAKTHVLVIPKDRDGLSQLSKADARHKPLLGRVQEIGSCCRFRPHLSGDGSAHHTQNVAAIGAPALIVPVVP